MFLLKVTSVPAVSPFQLLSSGFAAGRRYVWQCWGRLPFPGFHLFDLSDLLVLPLWKRWGCFRLPSSCRIKAPPLVLVLPFFVIYIKGCKETAEVCFLSLNALKTLHPFHPLQTFDSILHAGLFSLLNIKSNVEPLLVCTPNFQWFSKASERFTAFASTAKKDKNKANRGKRVGKCCSLSVCL